MFHEQLTKHIRSATEVLFSTMFGLQIEAGEPRHEVSKIGLESGVAAVVGMSGKYVGTGTVQCSAEAACFLAGQFLQKEYSTVDEEVMDGIGEIANMIVGNIKNDLELRFGPMALSTPTVIYGRNFSTRTAGANGWTVVPFKIGEMMFKVQATLTINTVANTDAKRPARVVLAVQR